MVPIPKPDSTTVLVVGAGPTGLAAAISLVEHGCEDVVVVDAVAQGENTSRALAVHAATLEVKFRLWSSVSGKTVSFTYQSLQTIGCAEELAARGVHAEKMQANNPATGCLISIPFAHLSPRTRYPYFLIIPQFETEAVLGERAQSLGIRVYRPCRATGFKPQDTDDGTVTVCLEGGETIRTKYIVGADGSKSLIRQTAGIGFSDPDGAPPDSVGQIVIADVLFEEAPDPEWRKTGNVFLTPGNLFLLMPIPHPTSQETAFRIGFSVPQSAGAPPHAPELEFIQPYVDRCGPLWGKKPLRVAEIIWSSRFRTHSAIAERMFFRFDGAKVVGGAREEAAGGAGAGAVCVLVGDAAHIHAPAGGQGMNLGLRDAVALAPVLVAHMRRTAGGEAGADADAVVARYAAKRRGGALRVIRLTKTLLSAFGEPSTPGLGKYLWWVPMEPATVRDWGLWILGHISFITDKIAYSISGLEDVQS